MNPSKVFGTQIWALDIFSPVLDRNKLSMSRLGVFSVTQCDELMHLASSDKLFDFSTNTFPNTRPNQQGTKPLPWLCRARASKHPRAQ